MERFWFWLAGFAVPMVLVVGFLIAKRAVEEYREKAQLKVKCIAGTVFYEELQKVMGYYPCTLGDFVYKRIDHKLAEKEGEHEQGAC